MSIYQKNLLSLKEHHPQVAKILEEEEIKSKVSFLVEDDEGLVSFKMLNDKEEEVEIYNRQTYPNEEEEALLKCVFDGTGGVAILIGIGAGQNPLSVIEKRENLKKIVIIEPDKAFFKEVISKIDLSNIFSNSKVFLHIGDENLSINLFSMRKLLSFNTIHTFVTRGSALFDEKKYSKINDETYDIANHINIDSATLLHHGDWFFENYFENLIGINHHYLFENLIGAFKDVPAILVAAGPSLDKNVLLLKEAKDKALVFSVDTAIATLTNKEISPDFAGSIDYTQGTYEKFSSYIPKMNQDISLLLYNWVNPRVSRNFPTDKIFWLYSQSNIGSWINNLLGGETLSAGAGTVAQLNLLSAIMMGCNPIIFVGQDLSYPANKRSIHALGTEIDNQDFYENIIKDASLWIKGNIEEKVRTDRAMKDFLSNFEEIISNNKNIKFINSTEGGAYIKGTEVVPLKEAIDKYCSKSYDINEVIKSKAKNTVETDRLIKEFKSVRFKTKTIKSDLLKVRSLINYILKYIDEIKDGSFYTDMNSFPLNIQKKMSQLDKINNKIDRENIWHLLQDITLNGLRDNEEMLHEISKIEKEKDKGKYFLWFSKTMQRLQKTNQVMYDSLVCFDESVKMVEEYYEKEKKIKLNTKKTEDEKSLELGNLYCDKGLFNVAKNILEDLEKKNIDEPKVFFNLAMVYGMRCEFDKMEKYFEMSRYKDLSFEEEEKEFRLKQAKFYENVGKQFNNENFWFKGVVFDNSYEPIQNLINGKFAGKINKLTEFFDKNLILDSKVKAYVDEWIGYINKFPIALTFLNKDYLAKLYFFSGRIFVNENKIEKAVDSFYKALIYAPNNPDYYIFLAENLFLLGKVEEGVKHLNNAVKIDKNYAAYWEKLGDYLSKKGHIQDAIDAYEQCFITLSGNPNLLKKMGDCYMAIKKEEAALEAYKAAKKILAKSNYASTIKDN